MGHPIHRASTPGPKPPLQIDLRLAGPPSDKVRRALAALALRIAERRNSSDSRHMLSDEE